MTRSRARELILRGAVTVDGITARSIGQKIDPEKAEITVSGQRLEYHRFVYIVMNKPAGYVSATSDRGEKTVMDLLPDGMRRAGLFPAGRLDKDTEGMLIITDDGGFGHRLTAPGKEIYKTYFARLDGDASEETVRRFAAGLTIDGPEKCRPAFLEPLGERCARVRICEGKFHQVKRMFAACGLCVEYLRREAIGALRLDPGLAPGQCRMLEQDELDMMLKNAQH